MTCYELIGGARIQWETGEGWRNRMAAQAQAMHEVAARRAGFIPHNAIAAAARAGYDRAAREFMSATDGAAAVEGVCKECGGEVEFCKYHPRKRKFCSDKCAYTWHNKHRAGSKYSRLREATAASAELTAPLPPVSDAEFLAGEAAPPLPPPTAARGSGGGDVEDLSATLARADEVNKKALALMLREAQRQVDGMTAREKKAALAGK